MVIHIMKLNGKNNIIRKSSLNRVVRKGLPEVTAFKIKVCHVDFGGEEYSRKTGKRRGRESEMEGEREGERERSQMSRDTEA